MSGRRIGEPSPRSSFTTLGSVGIEHDQRRAAALDPGFVARSPADAAKAFEVGLAVILRGSAVQAR